MLEPAERRWSDFAIFTDLSQDLLLDYCKGIPLVHRGVSEERE